MHTRACVVYNFPRPRWLGFSHAWICMLVYTPPTQGLGQDNTGSLDAGHCDGNAMTYIGHEHDKRILYYMDPLEKSLANRFGHDGYCDEVTVFSESGAAYVA